MSSPFKPTGMWESTRQKEINAFNEGAKYGAWQWKAYHDRLVKLNRQLLEENKRLKGEVK